MLPAGGTAHVPLVSGQATVLSLPALAKRYALYQRGLRHSHLQKYTELISTLAFSQASGRHLVTDIENAPNVASSAGIADPPKRRRADSLPGIATLYNRPRLDNPDLALHRYTAMRSGIGERPMHDDIHHDDEYRKQVLRELKRKPRRSNASPSTDGEETDKLIYATLQRSTPPNTDELCGKAEAYFLSGDEAAASVEFGTVDALIFTHRQQQVQWSRGERPICQLFQRMEDLSRFVSVQIPSRPATTESSERRKLGALKRRSLNREETDDPSNVLDLGSPLPPSILPHFLDGLNCQLLSRVRDAVLMGGSAERIRASKEGRNEWRDVLEWVLLSEGGHHTPPHTDSHGLATWITVQEGPFGFGWMSRPTRQERDDWMANHDSYTGGQWRYVILKPGQTVFFPSGTIHFVFRRKDSQTLALGGRIVQWSGIDQRVNVVIDQMRHPDSTNEEIGRSAPRYVQVVAELIKQGIKDGRVAELGGDIVVDRFATALKVRLLNIPIG
jgi:hypothetical protein